ncbi:MAG: hypothetical protein RDU25_00140 [Patescibacteria group bacterium]|nr:hypothetical protein [Patescibacteria group bacterium]
MGRTLCYEVIHDKPLPYETRREIRLAELMLNHHFKWTCEELSLEYFEQPETPATSDKYFSDTRNPSPRIATGFTKVRDDEWNAALIVGFMRWVSTRLPEASVSLYDEGDYLLPGYVLIRNGRFEVDETRVARQREYLKSQKLGEYLARYDRWVERARNGEFFNEYAAWEYASREEIEALGLTREEMLKAPLDEVVNRLVLPWNTEWLKAA